jgi:hypothetical protein
MACGHCRTCDKTIPNESHRLLNSTRNAELWWTSLRGFNGSESARFRFSPVFKDGWARDARSLGQSSLIRGVLSTPSSKFGIWPGCSSWHGLRRGLPLLRCLTLERPSIVVGVFIAKFAGSCGLHDGVSRGRWCVWRRSRYKIDVGDRGQNYFSSVAK